MSVMQNCTPVFPFLFYLRAPSTISTRIQPPFILQIINTDNDDNVKNPFLRPSPSEVADPVISLLWAWTFHIQAALKAVPLQPHRIL